MTTMADVMQQASSNS